MLISLYAMSSLTGFDDTPGALADLSPEAYRWTLSILNCVCKPLVACAGLPANCLCCLVFMRQGLRDRMNLCLFTRSLADLCYVITSLPLSFAAFVELADKTRGEELYFRLLMPSVGVMHTFRTLSGSVSLLVAVERCMCVVLPLRANSLVRTRTVALVLVVLFVSSLLGFSINFFQNRPVMFLNNVTGEVQWGLVPTSMWLSHKTLFNAIADVFFMIVTPLATMMGVCVATLITVFRLRAAMLWRRQASSSSIQRQEHQVALTSMLVLVSCVYIVCMIPMSILTVARLCVPEFSAAGRYSYMYLTITSIAFYVTYVDSSLNIFVYYSRSSRFRQEVKSLVKMRVWLRDQSATRLARLYRNFLSCKSKSITT